MRPGQGALVEGDVVRVQPGWNNTSWVLLSSNWFSHHITSGIRHHMHSLSHQGCELSGRISKEAICAHISRLPHGTCRPNTNMERYKVAQAAAQVRLVHTFPRAVLSELLETVVLKPRELS